MSDLRAAAQQALEALEICAVRQEHQWHGLQQVQIAKGSLRAALEQPEQEPVAWQWLNTAHFRKKLPADAEPGAWNPLYTHPPRREWRGLTDEQLLYVYNELPNWGMDMDSLSPKLKQFARAIEAALKERNA